MQKIVLIAVYDVFSKGVRGLHSYLKEKGHEVHSIYFKNSTYIDNVYRQSDMASIISLLSDLKPDYVGIAIRSPLFPICKTIINNVRQVLPDVKIIVGGAHPTADPESCIGYADYIVMGEGEYSIIDILNGGDKGIYKHKPFDNLDSLPFPHYQENTYLTDEPRGDLKKRSVYTTRGCFYACSYCQESILKRKPVRKSVKYFKEEIDYYLSIFPQTTTFSISDSIFTFNIAWLESFAREFSGSNLKFMCNSNASMLDEEMIKTLKSAGMKIIRLGVQSGSARIREEIFNRKDSLSNIINIAYKLKKHGILGIYDFIIENPYDTPETMQETRNFIKKLPRNVSINKFEMRYWPGTALTERALNDGFIKPDDVSGSFSRFGNWSHTYQIN